jgi:DNA-directed RNA polymerase specialized sigma24 family protein
VRGNPADEEIAAVVASIRPELRRLLFTHRIPPSAATDLVQCALWSAVAHWREIADHAQWLLGAVEFECLTYWVERGLRSPALRRPAPPPGLDHLQDSDGRVLVDLDLLRAMLPATRRRAVFARGGPVDQLRWLLRASAPAA